MWWEKQREKTCLGLKQDEIIILLTQVSYWGGVLFLFSLLPADSTVPLLQSLFCWHLHAVWCFSQASPSEHVCVLNVCVLFLLQHVNEQIKIALDRNIILDLLRRVYSRASMIGILSTGDGVVNWQKWLWPLEWLQGCWVEGRKGLGLSFWIFSRSFVLAEF